MNFHDFLSFLLSWRWGLSSSDFNRPQAPASARKLITQRKQSINKSKDSNSHLKNSSTWLNKSSDRERGVRRKIIRKSLITGHSAGNQPRKTQFPTRVKSTKLSKSPHGMKRAPELEPTSWFSLHSWRRKTFAVQNSPRHFLCCQLSGNQVYLFGQATKQRDEGESGSETVRGPTLKVLESPIGLITQKRSDEKKNHIKSCWPIPRAHCQNLTRVGWGGGNRVEMKNSILVHFLLMGLGHKNDDVFSVK